MNHAYLRSAVLAACLLGAASVSKANIVGSLYENTGGADASTVENGAANVTFSVANGSLDFDSRNSGTGYTIGGWLATGGASILTGAGDSANTMDNTIVIMSGTVSVTSGEQFTVTQDDGLVLTIGGVNVLNNPGLHGPSTFQGTYTGPTGNEAFTLEYSEVSGAPAVLQVDLPFTPTAVPEPSTVVAGALLLLPMGVGLWRTFRKTATA